MPTYTEAITNAGNAIARARIRRDSLTPHAAARAAHHPAGPSIDTLERLIVAQRTQASAA